MLDDLLGRFRKRGDELLPLPAEFESYTPLKADLRAHFRSLDNGRGTSLWGCRNEYLSALARRFEDPVAASAMKSAGYLGT